MSMDHSNEIAELKKDIGILLKWYGFYTKCTILRNKKNDAVKVENFPMASQYRQEEMEAIKEWETTNDELVSIANKYLNT